MAIKHGQIKHNNGVHAPYSFVYADQAAREAASGLVVGDLTKLALQQDTNDVWMLTGVAPLAWKYVGGLPTGSVIPVSDGGTGVSSISGLVKGNGADAMSPAVAGVDYADASHTHPYEPANSNIQAHIIATGNPHGTTVADIGAALAGHDHAGVYEPANSNIQTHIGVTGNPHGLTLGDIGAEPANSNIQTHIGVIAGNPHGTTAVDVGASPLGHDHAGIYSPVGHDHAGVYEPANSNIQTHIGATGNPHGTTATDIGAMATSHAANAITGLGTSGSSTDVARADHVHPVESLVITDTFVVGTAAEITGSGTAGAETGDVAICTTDGESYILQGTDRTNAAHWQRLLAPTGGGGSTNAVDISFALYPPLTSTNVQAAIQELQDNKMATSHAANAITGFGASGAATTVARSDHNHSGTYEPTFSVLGVAKGGTGVSTLTGIVKGNGAGAFSAAVAGTDYAAASHNHDASSINAGLLAVARGGTGVGTLSGYVYGHGTGAMTASTTIPGSAISGNISGSAASVTGTVAVANGGTGLTSAINGLVKGDGTSYSAAVAGTDYASAAYAEEVALLLG